MKFICDDGTTVYKLTDFGAARELQEGQQFVSLYGTEEYLHPDMYARAVLRKTEGKTFGATVDLWSIGVTLYHVATGNLPFRPYGGRRNKETMLHITTKKASGVISGIQTRENGPIEWSKELPANCQLSIGLKKFVTPLLAGLLEADSKKIWSFEVFFNEVTNTLSRTAMNIFHINRAKLLKVYIHPDETYEQLQNYITEQTNISSENQILLLKQQLFRNLIDDNTRSRGYPPTTETEPLVLFSKENNNVEVESELELPKFSEFQNIVSVENDAAQAKVACSLAHVCKRRIEKAANACNLTRHAVENFALYITELISELHKNCQHLTDVCDSRKETALAISFAQLAANSLMNAPSQNGANILDSNELESIDSEFVKETKPRVQNLYEQNVVENRLKLEWEQTTRPLKCPSQTRAPAKARTEVERVRDSWQHLVRDRATRSLSYNDEQFHNLERIKVTETIRRIKAFLEDDVMPTYNQFAENLGDWYKRGQTVYLQTMILCKDVAEFERRLEKFHENLMAENVQFKDDMKAIIEQAGGNNHTLLGKNSVKTRQQLKNSFRKFDKSKKEIMDVLKENNLHISRIEQLSEKLSGKLCGKEE